ncbi:MAG: hypothetical protein H0V44_09360 [Planctomycetes bacterium]|nr:hypothetical protein [Planctomycetota bacterium]
MAIVLGVARWLVAALILGSAWTILGLPALGMLLAARAAPPTAPPTDSLVVRDNRRSDFGRSYREQVGQLIHLHLEGHREEFGYAEGALIGDRIARIETDMMGVFVERVPLFLTRHLVLGLVNWNNRTLDRHFTREELQEISAITSGHRDHHDPFLAVSPSYSRGLQYHALHDISQYLIDNPLVHPPQIGCTAVAVGGARSEDGHLLVGRLFDFEGGGCFDADKVVYTVAPEHPGSHRFVSVSWGGMAGAVTGLNDAGLWISLNAAATGDLRFSGRPIVMVARDILEHCSGIDDALAVLRAADVFVSDGVLLASGREGRAVVAEKGPGGMAVRAMADDHLVLTNHFLEPRWADDRANAKRIRDGTTATRFARAEALVRARPRHDPASILALVRDRLGADGADVGFGNRSTINAWIGAHLVVADVTAGIIWVCEPFHGLGRAIPFGIDGPLEQAALPADPDLPFYLETAHGFPAARDRCLSLLRLGNRDGALAAAQALVAMNPRSFEANALLGQATADPTARRAAFERALTLQPAYPADRARIQSLLDAR